MFDRNYQASRVGSMEAGTMNPKADASSGSGCQNLDGNHVVL